MKMTLVFPNKPPVEWHSFEDTPSEHEYILIRSSAYNYNSALGFYSPVSGRYYILRDKGIMWVDTAAGDHQWRILPSEDFTLTRTAD